MWRIYYADDNTFDYTQGEPNDAPAEFVVCIVGYKPTGDRYIMHGWNMYRYDDDTAQWWGFDTIGLYTRLRERKPFTGYCEGYTVTTEKFNELMDKAHRDPDFPMIKK